MACLISDPRLRDPLTMAISFMRNPSHFRQCCQATALCWDHAIYLECPLPCPYATSLLSAGKGATLVAKFAPVFPQHVERLETDFAKAPKGYVLGWVHTIPEPIAAGGPHAHPIVKGCTFDNQPYPTAKPTCGFMPVSTLHNAKAKVNKLRVVTFQNLPQVEFIGDGFLNKASGKALEEATLKDLPNLTTIGYNFLGNCKKLKKVALEGLPLLAKIHLHAFDSCTALESFSLCHLPKLEKIESIVFSCNNMKVMKLEDLDSLTTIHGDPSCCLGLVTFSLQRCPKLVTIGTHCLRRAESLRHVTLKDLPELTTIEKDFISGCHMIQELTLSQLPKLETIGECFCYDCPKLKEVTLSELPQLRSIGERWFHQNETKEMGLNVFDRLVLDQCPKFETAGHEDLLKDVQVFSSMELFLDHR